MEISILQSWQCEQVIEWLKGVECASNYLTAFHNNNITGRILLDITASTLADLGVNLVGHQEVIMEAISHLKNFHFNLDKENLQFLSMQVNTCSTSIYKLLSRESNNIKSINTQILSDVCRAISQVKTLISWLDRYPFQGHTQYSEIRVQMLRLGLELATVTMRDRFTQDPIIHITNLAQKLSKLSDYIIQDITDPMLLQPCYLDLVTLKKKESDLGFYLMPSYQFIHRVTDIKYNSPAHNSGKVEDGDEIVQINYQTVVGWQYKKVLMQLQESATDVLLTLKKRPKHTKIYGQLGLIKLPSKKRSIPYRWDNLPSPRFELFNTPDLLMPLAKLAKVVKKEIVSDTEESSGNESESDPLTPTETKVSEKDLRLYMPKPRAVLQRRYTICGDDLTSFQNIGNLVLWHNRKIDRDNLDSSSLRDKSVSFGFGLELTQRPATTCLSIAENSPINRLKTSLPSVRAANETIEECDEKSEGAGIKVVRFDSNKSLDYNQDSKYVCNVEDTIIESFMPIPFVDEETVTEKVEPVKRNEPPKPAPRRFIENRSSDFVEAVNTLVVNRETVKRGRLDKSHSTPTYTDDSDVPPAIEPRQQAVKIPPVPPRKNATVQAPTIPAIESNDENKSKVANVIDLKGTKTIESHFPMPSSIINNPPVPSPTPVFEKSRKKSEVNDVTETFLELVTPAKVKTLTNKKKNSLMAKRRKVAFKSLGTSATIIQGHLYRRAKDKSDIAYWSKLYFVLIETVLYGFKNKEAQTADCVIFLGGFTVSLAEEVHSKKFAFKVYHPKKTFYLAAETKEALSQWLEYIRQATLKGTTNTECESRELYSEIECSEDEFESLLNKQLCTPSPLKPTQEKPIPSDQTPPSKYHYHLNFGSLKKFARGSSNSSPSENSSPSDHKFLGFFTSNKSSEKKSSADIVPTAQFKSYKKVKESNGGLQLGATSMINSQVSDMYLQSGADNSSILSGFTKKQEEVPVTQHEEEFQEETFEEKNEKLMRQNKKSLNYLHASNPNLLDFNFHSTVDFPTSSPSTCNWDHQQTGMTLLDLMKQQLDEEKRDMYNKRVEQGIEKIDERTLQKKKEKPVVPPKPDPLTPHIEKIQKRELPVTPDYAQSFKPDDKELKFTRTKEGQKLRDFGYELIHGDDSATDNSKNGDKLWTSAKRNDKVVPSGSLKKKSGFFFNSPHDSKNKIDAFKNNNDKLLKTATSPFFYDKNLQQSSSKVLRKNSAPNSGSAFPYFSSKLSFSSTSCKEKKLLGSPKLHRAIFGHQHKPLNSPSSSSNEIHEIFSPIIFPKVSRDQSRRRQDSESGAVANFPMYPELQRSLPPVFTPSVYSLKNPKND